MLLSTKNLGPISMSDLGAAGIGSAPRMMPPQAAPAPQQRPGLLSQLFSPDNRDRFKRLAIGLEGMTMNPNRSLIGMLQGDLDKRQSDDATNRTIAWLKGLNTPQASQAASALEAGSIDAGTAVKMALDQPADNSTALQQNIKFFMSQGMSFQDAIKAAQGPSTGTNVTVGGTDTVKIMPDGRLAVVDPSVPGGIRFVTPPGSAAADTEAANAGADTARTRNNEVYSDAAVGAIDSLIGEDGKSGMLADGGLFSLPTSGVWGSRLADLGISQSAVDVKNTLDTITSNIAFGRLQAMRDASRTGGALGGVSERELDLLANSLSAVKQNTSPERLRENLKTIKEIWLKISNDPIASAAYANAGSANAGTGADAGTGDGGDGFAITGSN